MFLVLLKMINKKVIINIINYSIHPCSLSHKHIFLWLKKSQFLIEIMEIFNFKQGSNVVIDILPENINKAYSSIIIEMFLLMWKYNYAFIFIFP